MLKRLNPLHEYFLLHLNIVVRLLILSDVVWMGALGFLSPIFAIFILDNIKGGNEAVVGVAASIYLVTKSLMQIPAAAIIDRIRGEKDDFWIMFIGSLMGASIPLSYLFIHTPIQLYITQFVLGVVIAFTFPSYMAIFTRHIDKKREGTDWGIYFTLTDLSSAATAAIGGVMAATLGYHAVIFTMVAISLFGACALFPIRKHLIRTPR
ncbi:MFS transporter [Candidatus Uhrbacteria bacterium]|nr:MFS transporter [Candidatus Uhrbacteria bacterium]